MTCELDDGVTLADLEDDECVHCGHAHIHVDGQGDGSGFCDVPVCSEPGCCNCPCYNYEKKGDMK